MRKRQEVERTFKNYLNYGYVVVLLLIYLLLTPLVSLAVSSLVLLLILTFVYFSQVFVGWRIWKKGMDIKYQQRVMGFFAVFNCGICFVIPFFYLSYGTIFFYISLVIYLLLLAFLFTRAKVIAEGIHNPGDSFIGKAFITAAIVIMAVAIPAEWRNVQGVIMQMLDDRMKETYVFSSLYLLGLLITFILPIFIYPAQSKIEEHPKGRKKLSRAKRKAQKQKNTNMNKNTEIDVFIK